MNIVINPEMFSLNAIADDGSVFQFVDSIGFSTGNTTSGFNRFDTAWQDESGLPYPKLNEAALVIYPMYNPYGAETPDDVNISSGSPLRDQETETVDYDTLRYDYGIKYDYDGYYTVFAVLLYRSDSVYKDTDNIYYDVTAGQVVDQSGKVYTKEELMEIETIQKAMVNLRLTAKAEKEYQRANLDFLKIYQKDNCDARLKAISHKVSFLAMFLSGAVVNYNRGMFAMFQQSMETIWEAINNDTYVGY